MTVPHGYQILSQSGFEWLSFGWIVHHADGSITLKSGFRDYDGAEVDAIRHDRELAQVGGFDRKVRIIQDTVADYFGCTRQDLLARSLHHTHARHVAMILARQLTPASSPELGRLFYRDHTTVLTAIRNLTRYPPACLHNLREELRGRLR